MKSNFNNIDIPDTLSIISNFILEKNMLYSVKKVHLIGIGGIGMRRIADFLKIKSFWFQVLILLIHQLFKD